MFWFLILRGYFYDMKKNLVIKNIENNKYFTGRYDAWWSLDIKDARTYNGEYDVEREIRHQTDSQNDLDSFENVNFVVIETVYIK